MAVRAANLAEQCADLQRKLSAVDVSLEHLRNLDDTVTSLAQRLDQLENMAADTADRFHKLEERLY